jgi:two-component system, OmpR family, sensor histidine kinase VicK
VAVGSLVDYLSALQLHYQDGRPVPLEGLAISRALAGEVVGARQAVGIHPVTKRRLDLLISAAPLKDGAGRLVGAVEVMRDISELRELDRLKDEFLTVAAHELKTPVTIVKGYAQTLLRYGQDLPERHRRLLESIEKGANRIDALVCAAGHRPPTVRRTAVGAGQDRPCRAGRRGSRPTGRCGAQA